MTRLAVLHDDVRVRELYRTILEAQGHGVLVGPVTRGTGDPEVSRCDLVIARTTDEPGDLARLSPLIGADRPPVICIDDDPDPVRDRWLARHGAALVLHGPVPLRRLVDAVAAQLRTSAVEDRPQRAAGRSAMVRRDSASSEGRTDVRGAMERPGRHLLLVTDEVELVLHCFPRERYLRVRGSVLGAREPVLASVSLTHGGVTSFTRSDASGRFELEPVEPGPSSLAVTGEGWTLRADLDLAPA